jgi:hypothetical protein
MHAVRYGDSRYLASDWLNRLRVAADDLVRARDWSGLHAMSGQLRRDEAFWPDLWGPWCAVAARHLGDPEARALLDRLVEDGFSQPELLGDELATAFGGDGDWAQLAARMASNVPAPALELGEWPAVTPTGPLNLLRLPPHQEAALRARIPPPAVTAWETALALLGWVASRWEHGDAHVDRNDAVECLERVDAGERFACVEYSLVLSQALNAVGIPARRLGLRQASYHVGIGRGHTVSEAWIDELARWVVLDGQNGLYWEDGGAPMGALELQACQERGGPIPRAIVLPGGLQSPPDDELPFWFSYFASISTTGATWSAGAFTPVFQRDQLIVSDRLEHDPARLYPDLSEIGVGVTLVDGAPAVRLATAHPFATGFVVREDGAEQELAAGDPVWVLRQAAGEHAAELAVRTSYGSLAGKPFRYLVR